MIQKNAENLGRREVKYLVRKLTEEKEVGGNTPYV